MESTRKDALLLQEIVKAEIYRPGPDGSYPEQPSEKLCVEDLIVTTGRNYIAQRIASGDSVASAMAHMAIGSGSTAAALGDTALVREVKRKALAISSAGPTAANVYTAVATFGGAADTITSAQIQEAGIFNHAGSGQGTMMQRVTFANVILADSDLLRITLETNVGST